MSLLEKISEDIKLAMKARDVVRLSTLRMSMSALKYAAVDSRSVLDSDAEYKILASEAKKRREAIEAYTGAGDMERAAQEQAELMIIEEYLPAAVSDEDIVAAIDQVVGKQEGEVTIGSVMGPVMAVLKSSGGTVDGNRVRELLMSRIKSK